MKHLYFKYKAVGLKNMSGKKTLSRKANKQVFLNDRLERVST